ncbi:hypothetical protein MAN88_04100 [Microcystis aeruginosa]|nr:hypothetical protein MAN88_04100 [Microcystis aeruginosa]
MGVVGIGIIYFLSYYIIPASPIRGSLILCVISLIDIGAINLCVLCVWSGSFHSPTGVTVS